ncbi:putative hydrolase of the HAD superfamily [Singulisphaera sp. GP187]|uniref:HAD family hydrolase n=1 Tax=Singulisphaera sp. GP187 TaxID=1882752 RepID=UPI000927E95B|nr:HAD family phosphatase [Singulisphaera sp. GP187]SIO62067.1 putative hydrolase of the HAD superfamily [Singulisphaera sp. GP187]
MTLFKKPHPVLIFDFGNVVAYFDYQKACDVLGRPFGLSGADLLERARTRNYVAILQQYERGALTAEEFSERFCTLVGLDLSHQEFAAAWSDIFWLNEPIARLVEYLKQQGYRLVLGSNTNALHAAQFQNQFAETLAHFDHLVLSHEIGHLKPSAEFYLACASVAGEAPATCLFIDDLAENVDGAKAAGLSALHFTEFPTLLNDLRAAGIDVPSIPASKPA